MKEQRYFRSRSRETIADLVRAIRSLQRLNNFPDSFIFQVFLNVCETHGGSAVLKEHLASIVKELQKYERA